MIFSTFTRKFKHQLNIGGGVHKKHPPSHRGGLKFSSGGIFEKAKMDLVIVVPYAHKTTQSF